MSADLKKTNSIGEERVPGILHLNIVLATCVFCCEIEQAFASLPEKICAGAIHPLLGWLLVQKFRVAGPKLRLPERLGANTVIALALQLRAF